MKIRCPECNSALNSEFRCKKGHQYLLDNGVLRLLNKQDDLNLSNWLNDFEDFRKNKVEKLDFDNLPESGISIAPDLWKSRLADLEIIQSISKQESKQILEIGSWNGWLANQLSKDNNDVVAVDYFIHEYDGLKARNHYANPNWFSIQMNLDDLSVFESKFDLIIFNRCLTYFGNPQKSLEQAKQLLTSSGKIIVTGINVKNHQNEAQELVESKDEFNKTYGKKLIFNNSKGYTTYDDLEQIKKSGFIVKPYSNFKNKMKFRFFKNKLVSYYCIYPNII